MVHVSSDFNQYTIFFIASVFSLYVSLSYSFTMDILSILEALSSPPPLPHHSVRTVSPSIIGPVFPYSSVPPFVIACSALLHHLNNDPSLWSDCKDAHSNTSLYFHCFV